MYSTLYISIVTHLVLCRKKLNGSENLVNLAIGCRIWDIGYVRVGMCMCICIVV